ncbi:mitochondrial distribution and morphology protein 10 [Russula earlei]|uniref:Mitochondrial distribution and morphology protein 10 n=1 Tax=Russula earlei TaxID=71964 RepID=A0ACC0TZD3_9AGAM|nr:mitochondrial distribution and morphology protein 10 [Russula earlei]
MFNKAKRELRSSDLPVIKVRRKLVEEHEARRRDLEPRRRRVRLRAPEHRESHGGMQRGGRIAGRELVHLYAATLVEPIVVEVSQSGHKVIAGRGLRCTRSRLTVLRTYYKATGWNEDNLYANFTRSSNAVLDFIVPRGLHLSISKSPNTLFQTTYSMNALPSLNGSVGYIFTSCHLDIKNSKNVHFKDTLDRFKVYHQPRRPAPKEEEYLAGERVHTRDYLLYGRLYVPTSRLDALYSTRLSPTLQALVAAISDPRADRRQSQSTRTVSASSPSNVMFSLQHDTGRWCTEYTYSAEDSMLGVRVLHNFGKLAPPFSESVVVDESEQQQQQQQRFAASRAGGTSGGATTNMNKRIDEEDAMEGGLRGRISAGAEIYFSAKEKSAGVSTGIRFTTLPDAAAPSFQPGPTPPPESSTLPSSSSSSSSPTHPSSSPSPISEPPTTITALFNPMMGHMSGAYTAQVSRDLSLSTRFDFNVYSYESEWTMGAEWWLRPLRSKSASASDGSVDDASAVPSSSFSETTTTSPHDVTGVVKARASTSNDIALLWEGRLNNVLVGLGVASNLSSGAKPIKSFGLELSYFSSG